MPTKIVHHILPDIPQQTLNPSSTSMKQPVSSKSTTSVKAPTSSQHGQRRTPADYSATLAADILRALSTPRAIRGSSSHVVTHLNPTKLSSASTSRIQLQDQKRNLVR